MEDYRNIACLSTETNSEMNKNRVALPKRILKIHDAIAESLKLTEFNIQEKSMVASTIAHGWITTLFAEQAVLVKLESKLEELKLQYETTYGKPDIPRFKIASEMKTDKNIKDMTALISEQTEIVRYLTEAIKIIKSNSFDINNAVKILNLEK